MKCQACNGRGILYRNDSSTGYADRSEECWYCRGAGLSDEESACFQAMRAAYNDWLAGVRCNPFDLGDSEIQDRQHAMYEEIFAHLLDPQPIAANF